MGEAKRRKSIDPAYGKPKRGLVISSPTELRANGSVFIKTTALDAQELRASLLYWDQLAWPANSAMFIGSNADAKFLEDAKVLIRPHYANVSGSGNLILASVQEQAFQDLDAQHPGLWAIGQGENSLLIEHNRLTADDGISFELFSAIPVPDKDVPLNEVLEFRFRRYDELRALRAEIDALAKAIAASEDPKDEVVIRLNELDQRCAAAIRVCSEWQFPVRFSNLKTSLDIKPFAVLRDALIALGGAYALGVSAALAAGVVGAHAASSLKVTGDFGWKGLTKRDNPYRYVSQFHKELF